MKSLHTRPKLAERILAISQDELLVGGGDSRMSLCDERSLNKYGCAPHARGAVALGSCTASSPTHTGVLAATKTLQRLRDAAEEGDDAVIDEADAAFGDLRERLRAILRLDEVEFDIAFCPSGTDAEILALAMVRAGRTGLFLNVVTGPSEVGSGTTHAAGGRHFDTVVPAGGSREPGTPVDDELSQDVRVETIQLRDESGQLISPDELDERADHLVRSACVEGANVLLHVVTHSKTGVYAPSFDKAAELREEFGDQVTVILDAAQARLSRRSIRAALELGYLVLITGSKFYGGPAFSGALLVPPKFAPGTTGLERLPPGLRDYMTASELPADWDSLRTTLPREPNPGLLLRWSAAMAQIEAYYETPSERRRDVMRAFEAAVPSRLGASEHIDVIPVNPLRERDSLRFLEAATTVFPFFVRLEPDGAYLKRKALKEVFSLLNRDLSGALPSLDAAERAILASEIHIGQPVLLSGDADAEHSVLRIALGAAMVTKVATNTDIGEDFDQRIHWLESQIDILRAKIELIVKHFIAPESP